MSGLSHRSWDTAGWKDAAAISWTRDGRVRPQGGFRGPKGSLHSAPEGMHSSPFLQQRCQLCPMVGVLVGLSWGHIPEGSWVLMQFGEALQA